MSQTSRSENESTTAADRGGMVVGVDGSPGSDHALAWAAAHSGVFGLVRPVAAWRYPAWALSDPMMGAPVPMPPEEFEASAKAAAEVVLASIDPDQLAPLQVVRAQAGPALVEIGVDANLLVVGTRGRGAIADSILGSVSSYVVAHSATPVAVVPVAAPLVDSHGRVVVGVDGSPNSVSALAWAIRTLPAEVAIEAAHSWNYNMAVVPEAYVVPAVHTEEEAKATLERTVAEACKMAGDELRPVGMVLEYGDPRNVLRHVSEDADLLILGSRGHQGVAHLLLGSVTTGLVHQPTITTIVVPPPDG